MALIQITRDKTPRLACCRARNCEAQIEWVRTAAGRMMPVNAPLIIARITHDLQGTEYLWIDDAIVHWVTCPEAKTFKRRGNR